MVILDTTDDASPVFSLGFGRLQPLVVPLPDTDAPIPDTATPFRALAIVERLLHVSGQFGLARSDAIAREDATERAEREISADAQRLIEERADGTAAQFDADADALAAGDLEV